jgi:hypothetical protein
VSSSAALAYCVLSAASIAASPTPRHAALIFLGAIELVGLFLVAGDLLADERTERWARTTLLATSAFTVVAAAAGTIAFYAHRNSPFIGTYGDLTPSPRYARVQAGFIHPNLLASFCVVAVVVLLTGPTNLPRWASRVVIAGLVVTNLLTYGRGVVALAVALGVYWAMTSGRRWVGLVVIGLGTAAMVVLTFATLMVDPTRPLSGKSSWSASERRTTVASGLRTAEHHVVLGVGLDQLPAHFRDGSRAQAHLTAIDVAATRGVPALIALAVLLLGLWRARARPTPLLWAAAAAIAVGSLGENVANFRHVWLLLGWLAATGLASPGSPMRDDGSDPAGSVGDDGDDGEGQQALRQEVGRQ